MPDKGSSLKVNILYQSFYEILAIVLPLITSPYIARVLGANNLGIFSYTYSIAYYFQLFGMLGIKFYGNRSIAIARSDKSVLNRVYSELLNIHILFSAASLAVYIAYCIFFERKYSSISYAQTFMVASTLFDISWLFFGLEKFKITVVRNTIIKLISVVLIFLFVRDKSDLWIYTLIMAGSQFVSQAILFGMANRYVSYVRVPFRSMLKHIRPLFVLFIPVISVSLYEYMDKILLGYLGGTLQLGFFENANKILNIPLSIIIAFGSVMLPRMSTLASDKSSSKANKYIKMSCRYMVGFSFAMSCGMAAIAEVFSVVFWGADFAPCGNLIIILSVSLPFSTFASIVRNQDMIPNGKDAQYTVAIIFGAVINLLLNVIFIPKFGAAGSAYATLAAEITVCMSQFFFVRKDFDYIKYIYSSFIFLIPSFVMFMVVFLIGSVCEASLITLVIQFFAGCITFLLISFIALIISKDNIVCSIVKKERKFND